MPDLHTLLVAEPVMVVAYAVFGVVGFGATLVGAPLLAHVLPVTTVVSVMAVSDLLAAWSNGWRLGQDTVRAELRRMLPAMFAGSTLGAWLLFTLPLKLLAPLLGAFVMLYALNGLRPRARGAPHRPLAPHWAWWFGGIGGVFSALLGAGGWIYSIYLLRRLEQPAQIRATQTALLMASSVVRVGLFLAAGSLFEPRLLGLVLALLPAIGLGLYIGHHIHLRLNRQHFLLVLHGVLLLTGASLLLRALLTR